MDRDRDILDTLARDQQEGMRGLLDRDLRWVRACVRNRLNGAVAREDIDECVSDVFVSFYQAYPGIDLERGSIRTFLATIIRRRVADRLRQVSRTAGEISLDDEQTPEPVDDAWTIDEDLITREWQQELVEEIDRLGSPDREILIHKYYLDESSASIGRRLGLKPGTVDTRAWRAVARLRAKLADPRRTAERNRT